MNNYSILLNKKCLLTCFICWHAILDTWTCTLFGSELKWNEIIFQQEIFIVIYREEIYLSTGLFFEKGKKKYVRLIRISKSYKAMYEPLDILDNVVKASIENCQYRLKKLVVTKCSKKVFFSYKSNRFNYFGACHQ